MSSFIILMLCFASCTLCSHLDLIVELSKYYIYPKLTPTNKWKFLQSLYLLKYEPFNQVKDAWNYYNNITCVEPVLWYLTQPNHNNMYRSNVLILTEYFFPKSQIAEPDSVLCTLLMYACSNNHLYWIEWILSDYTLQFNPNVTKLHQRTSFIMLQSIVIHNKSDLLNLLINRTNINISVTDYYNWNVLFTAAERINLKMISLLLANHINANQVGWIKQAGCVLWYGIIIGDTGYNCRRKANIVDFAIYLWMIEHNPTIKERRECVVKHLLKQNHANITKYVHSNLDKLIYHVRRNPYIYDSYKIRDALSEMNINLETLRQNKPRRDFICCFQ